MFAALFVKKQLLWSQNWRRLLTLPFGLLRLLKPCKVKRFLATEDLSVVGLVTGSSGNNGLINGKQAGKEKRSVTVKKKNKTKQKKRGPKQKERERKRGAMEMRVMKKRRKTFQSTLTNTHSARCSSVRDTCQTITFVSGRRRGVDLRRRALLLLFLLVFLTAATKGTGEREEDDAAL